MFKIAIAGASGRMGRTLVEACQQAADCQLSVALDMPGSPGIGRDAGEFLGINTGVKISDQPSEALADADYLIDFTRPEGTLAHLEVCRQTNTGMIIGTTGFDEAGRAQIAAAAADIPIVLAPNMSVGVNATFKLLEIAARILTQGYDIEVIEAHHRNKIDAPSGTALRMGEVIAQARGQKLADVAVYAREGVTGVRDDNAIGFATIRGGDIVGDHTVLFAGAGERIEITHRAASRLTYAHGSLRAVRFLAQRRHGLFDMQDVLGLRD